MDVVHKKVKISEYLSFQRKFWNWSFIYHEFSYFHNLLLILGFHKLSDKYSLNFGITNKSLAYTNSHTLCDDRNIMKIEKQLKDLRKQH